MSNCNPGKNMPQTTQNFAALLITRRSPLTLDNTMCHIMIG